MLVGLMTAVGVLRASGFLDFEILGKATSAAGYSAADRSSWNCKNVFVEATGLLLDIFKEFGTDCGADGWSDAQLHESVFYCMSVYLALWVYRKQIYTDRCTCCYTGWDGSFRVDCYL